jgi:hypothetical protein
MKLERLRPTAWQVTMHPLELAALVAAARWAVSGDDGELPPDALDHLRDVLDRFDRACSQPSPS